MKISWLQEFVSVAKCSSFSAAAEKLYSTQSNVSKHIRFLEDELNVFLFERRTRNIAITPAGKAMLPYAEGVLREYDRMCAAVMQFRDGAPLRFQIVSVPIMQMYDLPRCLREFQADHPNVELEMAELDMLGVVENLKQSETTIGILRGCAVALLSERIKWKVFPMASDELVMLCHRKHPLAEKEHVSVGDCLSASLITLSAGFNEYRLVLKSLGIPPQRLRPAVKCNSAVSLQNYVQNNYGVSMLTKTMAARICDDASLICRSFDEHPQFPLVIAARETVLTPVVTALIQKIIDSYNPAGTL
jgi:DNA-binding transcriptional LysR family regulator